ncbi:Protein kinase-like domain [Phytophthora cactorum]|nr:Protein kinase-like domain [Phytophthora cactorum]
MLCSRFAVQRKLHEALFGDIWLCCDRQDANRVVAVKQVHLDRVRQAFTRTFQLDNPWSEGYTLNSLQLLEPHENVLQTLDQCLEGDTWFIVMEFCDGGDLCQTLESLPQHRLPEVEVLPLFLQIVRGCVVAGSAYDPRAADVWSLGIILFVLLTGSPLVPIASEIEAGFTALQEFGVERVVGAWHMDELLTPAAVDLLGGMLQVHPRARLSVEEVMAHSAMQLP